MVALLPQFTVNARPKPSKLNAATWRQLTDDLGTAPATSGVWKRAEDAVTIWSNAIRHESGCGRIHQREGRLRTPQFVHRLWASAHHGFTSRKMLDQARGKQSLPLLLLRDDEGNHLWETRELLHHVGVTVQHKWAPWADPVPAETVHKFASILCPRSTNPIPTLTLEDLKERCKASPLSKATGRDGLNLGCISKAPEWIQQAIVDAVNHTLDTGNLPQWAKAGEITFLFKGGDPLEIGSYRPITIVPVISKVLAQHLRLHLEKEVDYILGNEQHGFRRQRGTTTPAYQAMAALRRSGGGYLLRIDLAKAFDAVPHSSLLLFLSKIGIDARSLNGIRGLYHKAPTYIHARGATGHPIFLDQGVRQGCRYCRTWWPPPSPHSGSG